MINKKIIRAVLAGFVFLLAACAPSAPRYGALGSKDDEIPLMSKVRHGVLPSGLKYYILENAKPENRAYITLAVNAGSVLEEEEERGLAHFVEHMAFDGTERFPGTEVVEYLRSLGMRFGADVNAYTNYDRTVYGIDVPIEKSAEGVKQLPSRSLDIIDDWTHAITFTEKDVDEERPIILEEQRNRLGAGDRASRELTKLLFEGSKYAERRPIGLTEVIESAPASRLKDFYKRWYRADTMTLIFAGDFDGAALEAELASRFTIEAPENAVPVPYFDLPPPQKGAVRTHIFTDPELTSTYIAVYYKSNWKPIGSTLKDYRESVIDLLIDSIISERLTEAEHNAATPFFSAYTGERRLVNRSLHYSISGVAKTGLAREALAALLQEKEKLVRYGFTRDEYERAKTELISNMEAALAEKEKINTSRYVSLLTEYALLNDVVSDIEWELNAALEMLPGITLKYLHGRAKEYFEADDALVFIMANDAEKEMLPSGEEIAGIVRAVNKTKIEKPKSIAFTSELVETQPVAGTITEESVDEESGVIIWTLSNGARVLLKETDNKNDEIVLSAVAKGGTASAPPENMISARLAAELTNASGLAKWTMPELTKKLSGKQVSISFNSGPYTRSIEGRSTRADIKTFFELLYLGFTAPAVNAETAEILKDEYRTVLAQRRENPESFFQEELTNIIYAGHPAFKPLEIDDLDSLDLKTAAEWTERCRRPADYTFVFAGTLDVEAIRPLVTAYLASIPAKAPSQWNDSPLEFPQGFSATFNKGKEDKSLVFLGHFANKSWDWQQALTAETLEEYLDIALIQEIREKLGGVYTISPSAALSPTPEPGALMLEAFFSCSPARAAELSAAVEAEFSKAAAGRLNNDTFNKARAALIKNWELSMQSNDYIARRLANFDVIFKIPLANLAKRGTYYEQVTAAGVSALAAEALRAQLVRVVLFPEARH
ncbi:MAG: insulinase family protein [Spirochaetaceae bacterium]|jgi:zinc protease|nr:insulinase family protein [Spirochaetaceae bacterium]